MKTTAQGLLTILVASYVLAGGGTLRAQVQNRDVDAVRAQIPRQIPTGGEKGQANEESSAEQNQPAPKMKGDDEFGEQMILARRAHVEPWTLGMDTQFFYTNNVALTPTQPLDETYLRTGFYAQYANRIVGDWFMDASVSSYWFLHSKYNFFDFHLLRAELGVTRKLPRLNDAFASVHYYWFHISDTQFEHSIFQNHMVNFNLQKIWKISRGQQFVLGTSADLSLSAQPSGPGRHELSVYAGHSLRLTEKWTVHSGLRGGYFYYPEMGRRDTNLGMTLGLTYALRDWAKLTLSAAGTMNRSNMPTFDYNNFATGVGVSFQVSF